MRCERFRNQTFIELYLGNSSFTNFTGSALYLSELYNYTGSENKFRNCDGAKKGGVFYLVKVQRFVDLSSSYYHNSAHSGGVFQCTNCGMTVSKSSVYENRAIDGGAFNVEDGGALTLADSTISDNEAEAAGGGIRLLTESYFDIENVQFLRNKAGTQSSAIDGLGIRESPAMAVRTSTFHQNRATSSTIQIMYGTLDILSCKFLDNYSTSQTPNVFIGFANVTLNGTTF